jgi:tetratricopeptide (TPR) repeat protein
MKYINLSAFIAILYAISTPVGAFADETASGSYLVSQFARNNGDIDDAINSLHRLHKDNQDDTEITSQLEGMLLLKGNVEEAVDLASEIRQTDEKDQLSSLLLALHEIKNNNPDNAATMLDNAFESGSAQLWLPLLSAWLDVSRNKLTKPFTIEKLGADVGRAAPLLNYHLALINAQAGFVDAAALNFKNAIEDPKNPPMRVIKTLLQFYKQNNSPSALTATVNAFNESHTDSKIVNSDMPATIATVHDGVAEVLYTMGSIMLGAEANNDAVIYMQLALYIKPDFSEAALSLGDAYGELQQYSRSNDAYGRIAEASPLYEQARLHIVINYDQMGKMNEAISILDKMAKKASDNPDALITKGDLLRIHGRYREAIPAYDAALKRIPDPDSKYWPVLFARGTCYERLGNWKSAERDLKQALVLKPDQPDVLNYLGYGWMERSENLSNARSMIEKAVKERPDSAEIIDSMGWALYLSGDYEGAIGYLEKAVELLPGDATVNDHLGDAYWRLGHKTEARYQWERSLNSSPDTKEAESLRHKLRDGLPILAETTPPESEQEEKSTTVAR